MKIKNLSVLCQKYTGLISNSSVDGELLSLEGSFLLNGEYDGMVYRNMYSVRIMFDKGTLPYIIVLDDSIAHDYPHKNPDDSLCLGVHSEIYVNCVENGELNIFKWFEYYVVPYFYTYEFYKDKGYYPFGERKHGIDGIVEYYKELFNVNTVEQILLCMEYTIGEEYRGHHMCPCGSKKNIRNCHKSELFNAQKNEIKQTIRFDIAIIRKEINNERNKQKSK